VSDTVGFVLYHVIYSSVWYYLWQVTVYTGTGAVWENPTCGSPILNPTHGALVLFIQKKDGSLQLCIDFQGLN